ncbi:MAG: hypothetical protein RL196_755 [Actinomycetota bacterium]|jgi:uncharacterized delta-60 repeat protein
MKNSHKLFGAALLVASALMIAGCSSPAATNVTGAGVLDSSFGTASDGTPDGVVNTSVGAGDDKATDVAAQADGKIVAVGDHLEGDSTNVVVARYNADGSLDESFGVADDGTPNGIVNTSLGNGDDHAKSVALQADGKIVVAGDHVDGDSSNVFVARYNTDGSLDETFGVTDDGTVNGVVNLSVGEGNDTATAVAVQTDGKVVVAGFHENGGSTDVVVARFATDGSLDASFGTAADSTPNGITNTSIGDGNDEGRDLVIQADGKIVVAGTHIGTDGTSDIAVLRYNTDGSLDASFGTADDGTANGIVDQSLGSGDDKACGVAVQADGKILVVGNHAAAGSNDIAVLRFNADGSLDESFGTAADETPNGVVNTSLGEGDDFACGLAVASDGKILVGGYHQDGTSTNITVLRFTTDGTLDDTFGVADDGTQNGVVNTSLGEGDDVANAIALQADGKLLLAGFHTNGDSTDIVIARYLTK